MLAWAWGTTPDVIERQTIGHLRAMIDVSTAIAQARAERK